MLRIRKANERGFVDHDWLKSRHTFSFASYNDPRHMHFRSLRVINEDWISGGMGFEAHPHNDMEIITYVLDGELEHQDSMGNKSVIRPGEVQRMSAGKGVVHSDYNKLGDRPTHLLQIWILPNQKGGEPGYQQKDFTNAFLDEALTLVASEKGRSGSIDILQDADVYVAKLKKDARIQFEPREKRGIWIQMARGKMRLNNLEISAGDAVAAEDERRLEMLSLESSEFLLFDLA